MLLFQPWLPLVLAYSFLMFVSLLGLAFMSRAHFEGLAGDALMIVLMSTGLLVLIWVPFLWEFKIFPAVCLAVLGCKVTRVEEWRKHKMWSIWVCFLLYFVSVLGLAFV